MVEGHKPNPGIERSRYDRQCPSLAASGYTYGLTVELGQRTEKIHRTDTSGINPLVIVFIPVIHAITPISAQRRTAQIAVHSVRHIHRYAVNPDLQSNDAVPEIETLASADTAPGTHSTAGYFPSFFGIIRMP